MAAGAPGEADGVASLPTVEAPCFLCGAAAASSTSTPATCQPRARATPSAPPEPHPTSR